MPDDESRDGSSELLNIKGLLPWDIGPEEYDAILKKFKSEFPPKYEIVPIPEQRSYEFTPGQWEEFIDAGFIRVGENMLRPKSLVQPMSFSTAVNKAIDDARLVAGSNMPVLLLGESGSGKDWLAKFIHAHSARLVAGSNMPVLLLGESGSGKDWLAKFIHAHSARSEKRMETINCGAIPEGLAETELFGHVKGAFTGAQMNKRSLFEIANGSTLFLNEIGDMALPLQGKLLTVLEAKEVKQVGGDKLIPFDVRIISATNRAIWDESKFRRELYHRINVMTIFLPSLSDRKCDIPILTAALLTEVCKEWNRSAEIYLPAVVALTENTWNGNIRELRNVIERAVLFSRGNSIDRDHIRQALQAGLDPNHKGSLQKNTSRKRKREEMQSDSVVLAELIKEYKHKKAGFQTRAANSLKRSQGWISGKVKKLNFWEVIEKEPSEDS
jgi:transcriptional regulator with GAF, ATPase, and Fis domain